MAGLELARVQERGRVVEGVKRVRSEGGRYSGVCGVGSEGGKERMSGATGGGRRISTDGNDTGGSSRLSLLFCSMDAGCCSLASRLAVERCCKLGRRSGDRERGAWLTQRPGTSLGYASFRPSTIDAAVVDRQSQVQSPGRGPRCTAIMRFHSASLALLVAAIAQVTSTPSRLSISTLFSSHCTPPCALPSPPTFHYSPPCKSPA